MYSCLRNADRVGYNVSRLSDYCQERFHIELGITKKAVGHVFAVDMGGQTTISGTGEIYENFKKTGQLNGYAGFGETPKTFFEKGYKSASLRYMKFDETYHRMPYDCRDSEFFIEFNHFSCDIFNHIHLKLISHLRKLYFPTYSFFPDYFFDSQKDFFMKIRKENDGIY